MLDYVLLSRVMEMMVEESHEADMVVTRKRKSVLAGAFQAWRFRSSVKPQEAGLK